MHGTRFTDSAASRYRRLARYVLERGLERFCVEGRHGLHLAETLRRVPDREGKHRPRIRRINDIDEIVVALRVVDRLDLDAELVEFRLGLANPLRLLACPFRAQTT